MKSMLNPSLSQKLRSLLLLVLFYSGQLHGLALGLALAGIMEGNHSVGIYDSKLGTHLVLSHKHSAVPTCHQHNGLIRTLLGPSRENDPDHDLNLGKRLDVLNKEDGVAPLKTAAQTTGWISGICEIAPRIAFEREDDWKNWNLNPWRPPGPQDGAWGFTQFLI